MVRDNIPDLIRNTGGVPVVKILGVRAYKDALRTKLVEEACECLDAKNKKILISELADVHEVFSAICVVENISQKEVLAHAKRKRRERGGFEKKIYLHDVQ